MVPAPLTSSRVDSGLTSLGFEILSLGNRLATSNLGFTSCLALVNLFCQSRRAAAAQGSDKLGWCLLSHPFLLFSLALHVWTSGVKFTEATRDICTIFWLLCSWNTLGY